MGRGPRLVAAWVAAAVVGCGRATLAPAPAHEPPPADGGVDAGLEASPALDRDTADGHPDTATETLDADAIEISSDAPSTSADADAGDVLVVAPGSPYHALALAVGLTHTCVLLDDHRVKCWGDGASGELGYGDDHQRGNPADMGDALPFVDLGTGRTARAISAGRYATCALLDDGTAKCWGIGGISGQANELGNGPGEMGDALPTMFIPKGRTIARIVSGVDAAGAVLEDGSALVWRGGMTTVFVPAASPVVELVHGGEGTGIIALFADGEDGVLDFVGGLVDLGYEFGAPAAFVAGWRFGSCAVLTSGRAVCSGNNSYNAWSSATVATRVASGIEASCVLTPEGAVRCRGFLGGCETLPQNTYWCSEARAGDGSVAVDLPLPAVDVQAGDQFACALLADGSVRCWGGEDDCVPYDRNRTSGYDCLSPATPPTWLGGGVALVTVDGQTKYGPWRAVDLGTHK